MTIKTYSEACERNRGPILSVISPLLLNCHTLLEIGSGNGQHAVYFAEKLPHLIWYTSDVRENHPDIRAWLGDAGLSNTRDPLPLDVKRDAWPELEIDAVFSANTAHIMHWDEVKLFFAGVGRSLSENGKFLLYGPFNYNQAYTSESNARFDVWLKARDPESGIRDFESLNEVAGNAGMELIDDYEMPANNRVLYWRKTG
jgi:cyclopropane fatty-acyl-phospholipid synthase-like methyltransferase